MLDSWWTITCHIDPNERPVIVTLATSSRHSDMLADPHRTSTAATTVGTASSASVA